MSKYAEFSENEDDPDPYESSGDEWKEEMEIEKSSRRTSTRVSRQSRQPVTTDSTDSEDDYEYTPRKKSKNGMNKRQKISNSPIRRNSKDQNNSKDEDDANSTQTEKKYKMKFMPKTIFSDDYQNGTFVIAKKDAPLLNPKDKPCIWRIDGKALLQKFEPAEENDKLVHKNTSVYTGWSSLDRDTYAPISVDVLHQSQHNLTVEVQWDKLKDLNVDNE